MDLQKTSTDCTKGSGSQVTAEVLYIVIPCYNEEAVLPETMLRVDKKLQKLVEKGQVSESSRVVYIDDGSTDKTWGIIEDACSREAAVFGIKLSRNRGHQNALLAGLMTAMESADMVISMDADLQDDIDAVDEMIDKYYSGNDIVYGVRRQRKTDSVFKRRTARLFYRIMRFLGAETIDNHADYRLMSKRALEALAQFKEVNLFLRGIVPLIGYDSDVVYYDRTERFAGSSKYPLKKMIAFAIEGITSLSIKPIRLITCMGFFVVLVGVIMLLYSLVQYFMGNVVAGWSSIMVSLWVIGGAILSAIGVIGEYIGKIYLETKSRPRYVIEKNMRK